MKLGGRRAQPSPFVDEPDPRTLPRYQPLERNAGLSKKQAAAPYPLPEKLRPDPSGTKVWRGFPFGHYKDWPFETVPTWYLKWFLNDCLDRGNGLHQAVEAELWERPDRDA